MEPIRNKVKESGILALNLLELKPKESWANFDISPFLYQGQIVVEKLFKEQISQFNIEIFRDQIVGVYCSVDAIVPQWVYMQAACALSGMAKRIEFASPSELLELLWKESVEAKDWSALKNGKVTLLASPEIPDSIYLKATDLLLPWVQSLMYGEPGLPKVIFKKQVHDTK